MENSESIDRISDLPDVLLCHILSFLPTKQAFSTTFLSKRWAPLFKLLTSLQFDDRSVHDDEEAFLRFRQLVDKVTLSTQLIKTFHLKCRSIHWRDDRLNVVHWIEIAKQHPLEDLQLISNGISLPPNIFRFSKLVVLKLMNVKVVGNISADLPSLQTLHLNAVYFENKENFNKFLCGCPILRNLHTSVYYIKNEEDEGVRLSTEWFKTLSNLIKAEINIDAFDVPLRAISNVKILMLTVVNNRLPEISCYYGGFPAFQNLTDLNLCFHKFHHWNDVIEVLQYCPKLRILSIFKVLAFKKLSIKWKDPNSVPECISSHLISFTINYEGWRGELQFLKYILQNAQLLEVMKVRHSMPSQDPLEELNSCHTISPKCILSIEGPKLCS